MAAEELHNCSCTAVSMRMSIDCSAAVAVVVGRVEAELQIGGLSDTADTARYAAVGTRGVALR